jgi:hypothetical protein
MQVTHDFTCTKCCYATGLTYTKETQDYDTSFCAFASSGSVPFCLFFAAVSVLHSAVDFYAGARMATASSSEVYVIEIVGDSIEEACLKKGIFFQLISNLFVKCKVDL